MLDVISVLCFWPAFASVFSSPLFLVVVAAYEEPRSHLFVSPMLQLQTLHTLPLFIPQIQNDLAVLTKRLSHLNDSIARKTASRNEYDKTIQETESAYLKARIGHNSNSKYNAINVVFEI